MTVGLNKDLSGGEFKILNTTRAILHNRRRLIEESAQL